MADHDDRNPQLGRFRIPLGREQEVDSLALAIDSSIQIGPAARTAVPQSHRSGAPFVKISLRHCGGRKDDGGRLGNT